MAKKDIQQESPDSVLVAAAKKIGKAAGKISSVVGATAEASAPQTAGASKQPSTKVPKLEKKNKKRLPRREKKARQKAGAF